MLSKHVEAQCLHILYVPVVIAESLRNIDPVIKIALIKDTVQKDRLVVQHHSGKPPDLLYRYGTKRKVGEEFILSGSDLCAIQPGLLYCPELWI